jgi:hypothetical protein
MAMVAWIKPFMPSMSPLVILDWNQFRAEFPVLS